LEFRHPLIDTAILDDWCDQFSVLVFQYQLRSDKVRAAAVATSRIRAMAKLAIDTV
jgi:hypothetical protein